MMKDFDEERKADSPAAGPSPDTLGGQSPQTKEALKAKIQEVNHLIDIFRTISVDGISSISRCGTIGDFANVFEAKEALKAKIEALNCQIEALQPGASYYDKAWFEGYEAHRAKLRDLKVQDETMSNYDKAWFERCEAQMEKVRNSKVRSTIEDLLVGDDLFVGDDFGNSIRNLAPPRIDNLLKIRNSMPPLPKIGVLTPVYRGELPDLRYVVMNTGAHESQAGSAKSDETHAGAADVPRKSASAAGIFKNIARKFWEKVCGR
ncbi:MAG: hypothetical protein LBT92_00015 [Rickettsiales bacterium]|jgi:hypothetical protein|nr:hypothetical protein [Rickettsiales bacterium]